MSPTPIFDSVFDLPQLNTYPSAEKLLSALNYLALEPPSWDHHQRRNNEPEGEENVKIKINEAGVPSYLTAIVGSSLSWIDEDRREEVWEAAGRRLSERCGRSAIPSVSRTFVIPDPFSRSRPSISISLHEPSLTSDNLGHKTWLASYLLAKRLVLLRRHLPLPPPLLHPSLESELAKPKPPIESSSAITASTSEPFQILELGAGTGLVGITAAALFPSASLHLTDLPAIVPNLQANVSRNIFSEKSDFDGSRNVTVGVLDWSDLPRSEAKVEAEVENEGLRRRYDLIIAADALYSPSHPTWLVNTINLFLRRQRNARVIIELPLREGYATEVQDFRTRMSETGLVLIEDGEEVGVEDWQGATEGDQQEVKCWWGVWRRRDDMLL